MGNQNSRNQTYEQYYEALKKTNPYEASHLNISGMKLDPYSVLGLKKNFSWDELKDSYKRIARVVHPDRGGSDQLFQMVTDCFKQLAHEYKLREVDRPHHELKKDAQRYYDSNPVINKPVARDENFLDRFNRTFEENKLEDEDGSSVGYAHMMAPSSKTREDFNIPQVMKKFSQDKFNKVFDKVTLSSTSKEVVTYKEPEALPLAKTIQYTEIGAEKPGDFSSGEGKNKNTLQYTDYMVAHTKTRLVDPRTVGERPTYKNVDAYEQARAEAMSKPATQEELQWRAQQEREKELKEQERLRRAAERDRIAASHHDKMMQLMLSGRR